MHRVLPNPTSNTTPSSDRLRPRLYRRCLWCTRQASQLDALLDYLGDTLVIYKPDRVARLIKEVLVQLEGELYAPNINLHILTGICAAALAQRRQHRR